MASLTDLALLSSNEPRAADEYEPASKIACDGFQIACGAVDIALVKSQRNDLLNLLNSKCEGLTIKHILPKRANDGQVSLWVTLSDGTKAFTLDMISRLYQL